MQTEGPGIKNCRLFRDVKREALPRMCSAVRISVVSGRAIYGVILSGR